VDLTTWTTTFLFDQRLFLTFYFRRNNMTNTQIRQGDVMLVPVYSLPKDCKHIEPEDGRRFVLAHGEVTGHAHAIYEFTTEEKEEQDLANAAEISTAAIARARSLRTAQMWESTDGEWYLEIKKTSTMKHEEHAAPQIPPGIYYCPVQVEAGLDNMIRVVAD
jgi:hypothetical protein